MCVNVRVTLPSLKTRSAIQSMESTREFRVVPAGVLDTHTTHLSRTWTTDHPPETRPCRTPASTGDYHRPNGRRMATPPARGKGRNGGSRPRPWSQMGRLFVPDDAPSPLDTFRRLHHSPWEGTPIGGSSPCSYNDPKPSQSQFLT